MIPSLTERESRIIAVLSDGREHSRNEITAKCGPVNVSSAVDGLCRKTGLQIPCQRRPLTDRDGKTVQAGFWQLTDADKAKINEWQEGGAA
jgi:hypothetical protein